MLTFALLTPPTLSHSPLEKVPVTDANQIVPAALPPAHEPEVSTGVPQTTPVAPLVAPTTVSPELIAVVPLLKVKEKIPHTFALLTPPTLSHSPAENVPVIDAKLI